MAKRSAKKRAEYLKNTYARPGARRAYLNDFKMGEDGKYSYEGDHRTCVLEGEAFKRWCISCWVLLVAACAAVVGAGCIPKAGLDGHVYIVLPYAFSVVFLVICIVKLLPVTMSQGTMRKYKYEKTVPRIPVYAMIAALLCLAAIIGLAVSIGLKTNTGEKAFIASFAALCAAGGALFAIFAIRIKRTRWN